VNAGTLQPVLEAYEDEPIGVHVVYPPTRHLTTKVRVFVDFLAARLSGGKPGGAPPWETPHPVVSTGVKP
jgi:DNA-binding transcriptional LysR family regulator